MTQSGEQIEGRKHSGAQGKPHFHASTAKALNGVPDSCFALWEIQLYFFFSAGDFFLFLSGFVTCDIRSVS